MLTKMDQFSENFQTTLLGLTPFGLPPIGLPPIRLPPFGLPPFGLPPIGLTPIWTNPQDQIGGISNGGRLTFKILPPFGQNEVSPIGG